MSFTVERTYNQSVQLTWEADDFTYVKIVRRLYDYPSHHTDGVAIFEGSGSVGVYEDQTDLVSGRCYYYALFYSENPPTIPYATDAHHRKYVVYVETGTDSFYDLLKSFFPKLYFYREDITDDPNTTGLVVKALLQPPLEELEGLIRWSPNLFDVDETPGPYLQPLASLVGIVPNLELSYMQQRGEIKAQAQALQWKGTNYALELYITAITGCACVVDNWSDNILITNNTDRILPDVNNAENFGFVNDPYSYVFDSRQSHDPNYVTDPSYWDLTYDPLVRYNTINFGVFIELKPGVVFDPVLWQKIGRVSAWWSPFNTHPVVVLWDIYEEEGLSDSWSEDHGGWS